MLVESYDSRILRFERFEDSAESSNRILEPKNIESNLESNLKIKECRIESRIESYNHVAPNRISNRILGSLGLESNLKSNLKLESDPESILKILRRSNLIAKR